MPRIISLYSTTNPRRSHAKHRPQFDRFLPIPDLAPGLEALAQILSQILRLTQAVASQPSYKTSSSVLYQLLEGQARLSLTPSSATASVPDAPGEVARGY
jgi:hypothetical protein